MRVNDITTITRRNIWDGLKLSAINPYGRYEEPSFLTRLWDLSKLPSTDSRYSDAAGDIWQHRINNYDWNDDWLLHDSRFNLLNCPDETFLNFLCETLHPIVRGDLMELHILKNIYNEHLAFDGYKITEHSKLSGRPVFKAIRSSLSSDYLKKQSNDIVNRLSAEYVSQQMGLMENSIATSPHVAIGLAKELIETCCKSIFIERQLSYDNGWDLPKLMKETTKLLKLTPDDIPDEAKASTSIKQILGSLTSVVQGIGEIRNAYGSGHGKAGSFKGLQPRHAKLAVGAASTLAIYLLDSHELKP